MPWLGQCKNKPGKVFFCPLIFTSSPPSQGWWVCGCWGWIIKFQPFLQRFQPRGLSSGHHKGHPETFHLGVNYVSGRGIQLIRPISKPSQSNCKCWDGQAQGCICDSLSGGGGSVSIGEVSPWGGWVVLLHRWAGVPRGAAIGAVESAGHGWWWRWVKVG